jgi:hypothetical protein
MDQFDKALANSVVNPNYSSALRAAAKLGKDTMNRYYEATDASKIYRLATGMIIGILTDVMYANKISLAPSTENGISQKGQLATVMD